MANKPITEFIEKYYLHFNAASLVDASKGYVAHLKDGGKMLISLAGAMSTAELGKILAEMIRQDKDVQSMGRVQRLGPWSPVGETAHGALAVRRRVAREPVPRWVGWSSPMKRAVPGSPSVPRWGRSSASQGGGSGDQLGLQDHTAGLGPGVRSVVGREPGAAAHQVHCVLAQEVLGLVDAGQ